MRKILFEIKKYVKGLLIGCQTAGGDTTPESNNGYVISLESVNNY